MYVYNEHIYKSIYTSFIYRHFYKYFVMYDKIDIDISQLFFNLHIFNYHLISL